MEIKQLSLRNFGQFDALEIPLAPTESFKSKVTVLVGINGGGKTSILRALASSLSWLSARLRSGKGSGIAISELDILNGKPSASIKLSLLDPDEFQWELAKSLPGRKGEFSSQLGDATRLAEHYRAALTADAQSNLPLIAYYPVERSVLNLPLRFQKKYTFSQLDGYTNSIDQGVDFQRFFAWFREREDIENELSRPIAQHAMLEDKASDVQKFLDIAQSAPERLDKLEFGDVQALRAEMQKMAMAMQMVKDLQTIGSDKQLDAVRHAISQFMPGFSNLRVRRKPSPHMLMDKNGKSLKVNQLSQGEKSLMALVGDIARRLAMLNPGRDNPLEGEGIVLIDEVDLHLHPQWARSIIERLRNTFPNCQFVLTTHSPLVISDCKDVLVYTLDDGKLTEITSQYGQDANTVLLDVMQAEIRNPEVEKNINDLLDLIHARQLEAARALLQKLEAELPGQNMALAKASLLLRKEVLRHAQN